MGTQAAYVLVRSDDLQTGAELKRYVSEVDSTLDQYGGEILVQGFPAHVLEGEWQGFVTLLRFESVEAARRWYDSPEYGALAPLRQGSSRPTAIIVDGVGPGHRSSDLLAFFG
ncbi:DUF1330 domain-containing protein [Actinomycetota bacterium]